MKATEQLIQEHQGIMLMLNIMNKVADKIEKAKELNKEHTEKIIEFLKIFADKCHHGKEEDILFFKGLLLSLNLLKFSFILNIFSLINK